jgi:hypothetical protein
VPRVNTAVVLDSGLEKWLYKTARKNYWRVAAYYELEDLVADGYLVYAECAQRYRDKVTEKRHFMALFRTCYLNHITDLANRRARDFRAQGSELTPDQMWVSESAFEESEQFGDLLPPTLPDAEIAVLLSQAQGPLQLVIKLFYTDAGIELLREVPQKPRESTNSYLCRLLGIDAKENDLYESFRSFVSGKGMYYLRRRMPA